MWNKIEKYRNSSFNGSFIYGLTMFSTGLTLERAKKLGYNTVITCYEDLQKPGFIEHNDGL